METLAERLQWVIEHRGFKSAHDLSKQAGLGGGHVGMMIRGEAGSRPAAETIEKIAKVARVPTRWLSSGEGDPETFADDSDPLYGNALGWTEREAEVQADLPGIPAWVYKQARRMRGVRPPDPLTKKFVEEAILYVWRNTSDDEKVAKARAQNEATIKRINTTDANRYKKAQAEAAAKRETSPPLPLEEPARPGARKKR